MHIPDSIGRSLGGWDTHTNQLDAMQTNPATLNGALGSFATEMRRQGVWDSVTVQVASEFGRSMTCNGDASAGTDHGWGGNALMLGGALRGGTILGTFPHSLKIEGELTTRGRVIPTTSWEELWHAHAEWLGVEPGLMAGVLPNLENFPTPLNASQVYQ